MNIEKSRWFGWIDNFRFVNDYKAKVLGFSGIHFMFQFSSEIRYPGVENWVSTSNSIFLWKHCSDHIPVEVSVMRVTSLWFCLYAFWLAYFQKIWCVSSTEKIHCIIDWTQLKTGLSEIFKHNDNPCCWTVGKISADKVTMLKLIKCLLACKESGSLVSLITQFTGEGFYATHHTRIMSFVFLKLLFNLSYKTKLFYRRSARWQVVQTEWNTSLLTTAWSIFNLYY